MYNQNAVNVRILDDILYAWLNHTSGFPDKVGELRGKGKRNDKSENHLHTCMLGRGRGLKIGMGDYPIGVKSWGEDIVSPLYARAAYPRVHVCQITRNDTPLCFDITDKNSSKCRIYHFPNFLTNTQVWKNKMSTQYLLVVFEFVLQK